MIEGLLQSKEGPRLVSILASDDLYMAADRMRKNNVASLVVLRDGALVGLVSEREIVKALANLGRDAVRARVEQVMLRSLPTIAPTDTFRHAMRLMTNHRARHLPVVDGANVLGVISIGDVVKARLDDLEVENNVLRDVYIATSHA